VLNSRGRYDLGYITDGTAYYTKGAIGRTGVYDPAAPEQPGNWHGKGLEPFGLKEDEQIDPVLMKRLYHERINPKTGEKIGRAFISAKTAEQIDKMVAAELVGKPYATEDDEADIAFRIRSSARQSVVFFDLTYSAPKGTSVLQAACWVRARQFREAGDEDEAKIWDVMASEIDEVANDASQAGMRYLEAEAAFTRTGQAGSEIRKARGLTWGSFIQHTARPAAGSLADPDLHVHNAPLNQVQRADGADDVWRTLDSKALLAAKPMAGAIMDLTHDQAMSRLGYAMVKREDGTGCEVQAVRLAGREALSKRSGQVRSALAEAIAAFTERYKRKPTSREMDDLRERAAKITRARKVQPADAAQIAESWSNDYYAATLEHLADVPEAARQIAPVLHVLGTDERQRCIRMAVHSAMEGRAKVTPAEIGLAIYKHLPGAIADVPADTVATFLKDLVAEALSGTVPGVDVVCLTPAPLINVGPKFTDVDGRSIFDKPWTSGLWSSRAQLEREGKILDYAGQVMRPLMSERQAAEAIGVPLVRIKAELRRQASDKGAARPPVALDSPREISDSQALALFGLLTDKRTVSSLHGVAGAGKTTTVGSKGLAGILEEHGAGLMGLAAGTTQANILKDKGLGESYSIADFLGERMPDDHRTGTSAGRCGCQENGKRGHLPLDQIGAGLLDEATTVGTAMMAELVAIFEYHGRKLILTGDPEQMGAVLAAGGMAELIARENGRYMLAEPRRFEADWEGLASVRLRQGDRHVIREYQEHGRVLGGSAEELSQVLVGRWLGDYAEGRRSFLLAHTNQRAAELAAEARARLVEHGYVQPGADITLRDGNPASVGDRLRLREKAEIPQGRDRKHTFLNRDTVEITGWTEVRGERYATVRKLEAEGEAVAQPQEYRIPAAKLTSATAGGVPWAELAYAGNVWVSVGGTVHGGYGLAEDGMTREDLYVLLTRGVFANVVGAVTEEVPEAVLNPQRPRQEPRLPAEAVLAGIMSSTRDDRSATEAMRDELAEAGSLKTMHTIWRAAVSLDRQLAYEQVLDRDLGSEDRWRFREDAGRGRVYRHLMAAELAGHDAGKVLAEASAQGEMRDARSVADVTLGRVRRITGPLDVPAAATHAQMTPALADPELARVAGQAGEMADQALAELGRLAAATEPVHLVRDDRLGPVPPAETPERASWERAAGVTDGLRELTSWQDPVEALGREPEAAAVDLTPLYRFAAEELRLQPEQDAERAMSRAELEIAQQEAQRAAEHVRQFPRVAEELAATRIARDDAVAASSVSWADAMRGEDGDREQKLAASEAMLAMELSEREERLAAMDTARREAMAQRRGDLEAGSRAAAEEQRRDLEDTRLEASRQQALRAEARVPAALPDDEIPAPEIEPEPQPEVSERVPDEPAPVAARGEEIPLPDEPSEPDLAAEAERSYTPGPADEAKMAARAEPEPEPEVSTDWQAVADHREAAVVQEPQPQLEPAASIAQPADRPGPAEFDEIIAQWTAEEMAGLDDIMREAEPAEPTVDPLAGPPEPATPPEPPTPPEPRADLPEVEGPPQPDASAPVREIAAEPALTGPEPQAPETEVGEPEPVTEVDLAPARVEIEAEPEVPQAPEIEPAPAVEEPAVEEPEVPEVVANTIAPATEISDPALDLPEPEVGADEAGLYEAESFAQWTAELGEVAGAAELAADMPEATAGMNGLDSGLADMSQPALSEPSVSL